MKVEGTEMSEQVLTLASVQQVCDANIYVQYIKESHAFPAAYWTYT